MKVVMTQNIGGTRDGVKWPPVGSIVELPTAEAEAMCVTGYCVSIKDAEKHEEKTKREFVKRGEIFNMVELAAPLLKAREERRIEEETEVAIAAAANVERAVASRTKARASR